MSLQVWNVNACSGCVGVFNLQGAAWDRRKRQFIQHEPRPPALEAVVRPVDVEAFSAADSNRPYPAPKPKTLPTGRGGASANGASANGATPCDSSSGSGGASSNGVGGDGAVGGDGLSEPTWAAVSSAAPGKLARLRAHEGLPIRLGGAHEPFQVQRWQSSLPTLSFLLQYRMVSAGACSSALRTQGSGVVLTTSASVLNCRPGCAIHAGRPEVVLRHGGLGG